MTTNSNLEHQLSELESTIGKLTTAVTIANQHLRSTIDDEGARVLNTPSVDMEFIVVDGKHVGGIVRVQDVWVEFDQLVPIGLPISSMLVGKYRLTGVVPVEHIDDCTYRCTVQTIIKVAE